MNRNEEILSLANISGKQMCIEEWRKNIVKVLDSYQDKIFKEIEKTIKVIIADDVDIEFRIEGEDHIITRSELITKIRQSVALEPKGDSQ